MKNTSKIIGLTGNIATGKSVVRRMLANSGGLGIDADLIGHRILYPGGPAYQEIIDAFGENILKDNGQISRGKLGEIVFNDSDKLAQLESLTHPMVMKTIQKRIQTSKCSFTAVEAIKLFESDCADLCDSFWVAHASRSHQLDRLMKFRNMDKKQAMDRIDMQPPQSTKLERADVVISTEGTFNDTWLQVQQALNDTIKADKVIAQTHLQKPGGWTFTPPNQLSQYHLAAFWEENSGEDIQTLYEWLGMHMVLPISKSGDLKFLIIWDNTNFTATLRKIIPERVLDEASLEVFEIFQEHCQNKQCEVIFLPEKNIKNEHLQPEKYGFQQQTTQELSYLAWQEAGEKFTMEPREQIWVKTLAQPIETNIKYDQT